MKIMLVGKTGSGKTTLTQILNNQKVEYKKTQMVDYIGKIIDTPGEYLENKAYYKALNVVSIDADIIILIQSAIDYENLYPPNFASMFLGKKVLGVITKIDLEESCKVAEKILKNAGVEKIFFLDLKNLKGVEFLKTFFEVN
ncbi:MAG: EutP/PduV family microcompartment system protein [Cetobacterium sp.]|uniref:EutP/PduV family microcompartment system protein n=1 Tax=Cetobacterium sp. TaxID=2071632 RepID=UPI003F377DCA